MIDWKRVTDLRQEVGEADFNEVVDLFLEEVEEVVERLKLQSNHPKIRDDLHFLKGSSLNLGFASFSSLCEQGERIAAQGLQHTIDLEKIFLSFESSRTAFCNHSTIL